MSRTGSPWTRPVRLMAWVRPSARRTRRAPQSHRSRLQSVDGCRTGPIGSSWALPLAASCVRLRRVQHEQGRRSAASGSLAAEEEIHPALAFGSVIAGTALMGIAGAFLALPVAATAQAFITTWLDQRIQPSQTNEDTAAPTQAPPPDNNNDN